VLSMNERNQLPDKNRLSVLAATILLAYALTRFVDIPPFNLSMSPFGVYLVFQVNFRTLVAVLVAALAATGSGWLVSDHPALIRAQSEGQSTLQHWILPALTAWIIGIPLNNLAGSLAWWIAFGLGGLLLVLVFIAEYAVVDASDIRFPAAVVGLTGLSFTVYLIIAIAVRSAGLRLYLILPALVPAIWLVCLRTLYLRLGGKWLFAWATVIALIIGQIVTGLHYLPVSPVKFGLLLLGPSYALTTIAGSIEEGKRVVDWLLEPLTMLVIIWGLAIWLH
jgi:hypothetical protein